MKLFKRLGGVLIATGLVVSLFPGTIANATTSSGQCFRHKTSERAFARKMNLARDNRGRASMHLDKHLTRVARAHTRAMVRRDRLYHTPSRTLGSRVTRWRVLGENVGVGGDVTSLHKAFMNSPAHRDNILYNSYRHVGVGVKMDGNTMWVTVIFESRNDPGTTMKMPRSC